MTAEDSGKDEKRSEGGGGGTGGKRNVAVEEGRCTSLSASRVHEPFVVVVVV